jgi:hypothetical protein
LLNVAPDVAQSGVLTRFWSEDNASLFYINDTQIKVVL